MKRMMLVFALAPALLFSQTRKQKKILAAQQKADEQAIGHFKDAFLHLSDEKILTAQPASVFIASQFQLAGLQPKGTNGYLQLQQVNEGKQIDPATFLKINGTQLAIKKEYFPLCYSASKQVNGMPAMALRERGVPWFTDIKDWLVENNTNAAFDINRMILKEAAGMAAKGATALFVYNSGSLPDNLYFNSKDKTPASPIPVIYVLQEGYKKYLQDNSQVLDIELNVSLKEVKYTVNNVAGYIDNHAPATISIASFYTRELKTENIADTQKVRLEENAAISAMLIELSKMLTASTEKSFNYLFIALDGTNAETENSLTLPDITVSAAPIHCIINLRNAILYNEEKNLSIIGSYEAGFGSPEVISTLAEKPLRINCVEKNGFINSEIIHQNKTPVVFFVKAGFENVIPLSDPQINFERELQITKFITKLITDINAKSKFSGKND